jgi:hypothetical protein
MRFNPLSVIAGIVIALVVGSIAGPWLRWIVGLASIAGAVALVVATRCDHRHATLLPPVHDAGPDRDHARWYCDRCGQTWPATFASDTKPRLIYRGYDEHKALGSSARADLLEKERRRLAVKRAGWARTPAAQAPAQAEQRSASRPLEIVPRPGRSAHTLSAAAGGTGRKP